MTKKFKLSDRTEAAVELRGPDSENRIDKSKRRRWYSNPRCKCVTIVAVVIIFFIILISLGTLIVYSPFEEDAIEYLESIPGLHYHGSSLETQGNLIGYRKDNITSIKSWTDIINKFLKDYRKPGPNHMSCDYDRPPDEDEACWLDVKNIYPCTTENNYGYHLGRPCIFLKFNKFQDWIPEFYNDSSRLPEIMPENLKNHIKKMEKLNPLYLNTVWVSCDGESPADKENVGPVEYLPKRGFPGYYFPYRQNMEDYLSPLVAVHFDQPRIDVVISVECRLWAQNVEYNQEKGSGLVRFQLLID